MMEREGEERGVSGEGQQEGGKAVVVDRDAE